MRKVILFIAMSLDGYIADSNGGVERVYSNFITSVITHNKTQSSEKIGFTDKNATKLLKELKADNGKDIWICGGANLISQLMREELIDIYYISVIPTLLGKGIRLFGELENEQKLFLIKSKSCNGIVELIYQHR